MNKIVLQDGSIIFVDASKVSFVGNTYATDGITKVAIMIVEGVAMNFPKQDATLIHDQLFKVAN